ncbi:MAG: GAF domain-containing protein [Anaerolineales bacterium]|nr:GAF domain-containing protein [Anaerolineales bacterium]
MNEQPSSTWKDWLRRANQVAATQELGALLHQTLQLLIAAGSAQGGVLLALDPQAGDLVCMAAQGSDDTHLLKGMRIPVEPGMPGKALAEQHVILFQGNELECFRHLSPQAFPSITDSPALALPLPLQNQAIGVLLLFAPQDAHLDLLELLAQRMATEISRAAQLQAVQDRNLRLQTMIDIFGKIGSTLDRDRLLRMLIDYAREVIHAEACSLFLVDDASQDIVLHLASPPDVKLNEQQVRVPAGKGIIGHVVETGDPLLVPDVSLDNRHYRQVDKAIGFITRAILAVPLRSRTVILGQERGTIQEHVIGGFEAVNKVQGTFDNEDSSLLTTLANQAATVLQIADLYNDANDLFLDLVRTLTTAIDAKDPYTEGHSQRVSDFSVVIARQMGLPAEVVHKVRIGSLLHDIGKIGIPDSILTKPGRLTDDEFDVMKQHPQIGANIIGQVRRLHQELPALSEHHERLDGSGYPAGLKGDQVSLLGRIVAVADVFDALTSDRPYRGAMPVEEALDYLFQRAGRLFDEQCVQALAKGYILQTVVTERERLLKRFST